MTNIDNFPFWNKTETEILAFYQSSTLGLNHKEACSRLKKYGPNELAKKTKKIFILGFLVKFFNPLTIVLLLASFVSLILGGKNNFFIILAILGISAFIDFFQEFQAERATDRLRKKVAPRAEVIRNGSTIEIPFSQIVIGDIVQLSLGDLIPADARLIKSNNLFVDESILTGESFPVKKSVELLDREKFQLEKMDNCVFMGTSVVLGGGKAVIIATGKNTQLGKIASELVKKRPQTDFEKGVHDFSLMITKITAVLVAFIFLTGIFLHHDLLSSIIFSLAIAIGLVPEFLPIIITINLSKGAIRLSKKEIIVKNLSSIQDFGSMEILCTDKTGTLTKGKIELSSYEDFDKKRNSKLASFSYLQALYQSGRGNPMAEAIVRFFKDSVNRPLLKLGEIPFDYSRRMSSVVVEEAKIKMLISQGSPESILPVCSNFESKEKIKKLIQNTKNEIKARFEKLSSDGIRVLAVGYKKLAEKDNYSTDDEKELTFLGFVCFADPIKEGVAEMVTLLKEEGVEMKILTGDNELVTEKVCRDIGLLSKKVITGETIDLLSDEKLLPLLLKNNVFARINPKQKERIILLLKKSEKVVGFLGDGVNDGPSLRASDIGISVNNGSDVAKDTADLILLKKDLSVLKNGIEEGRKTYGNIIKYITLGTSSDFGNMSSMAIASLFLPFFPMLPMQILLNDLLYDVTQLAIPSDNVDIEETKNPKNWNISFIKKFMFTFGPLSSIFDLLTFAVLLFLFKKAGHFFQTGWFVESIVTQSLIVLCIRTKKVPFFQSRPSKLLLSVIVFTVGLAIILPLIPLGKYFSFSPLPAFFYLLLILIVALYFITVEIVKMKFFKKVAAP